MWGLDFVQTAEGRVMGDGTYVYDLKDHLGNVRASIDQSGVRQSDDYYPFGMTFGMAMNQTAGANKYLYNGKELQDELGLDWHDFGFRFYDAQLARFHSLDLLTEKNHSHSPFAYAANNPIKYIDWLGLDTILVSGSGRFSKTILPDSENNHDVILRVSERERRKGEIKYNRDGSLRSRHKSLDIEKDAFNIDDRGAVAGGKKVEGVRLSVFKDSESAKGVFEFLASSTYVEWSYVARLDNNRSNVLIDMFTSHKRESETLGASFTLQWARDDRYTVFSHIHSHPSGSTPQNDIMPSPLDIGFRNRLMQYGHMLFGVYNRGTVRGYESD
jgi:RHS repeat-associated protein